MDHNLFTIDNHPPQGHVDISVHDHNGHFTGSGGGSIDFHPTPDSTINVGGHVNTGGGWEAGATINIGF